MNVEFAELHTELFFAGKNFGKKLIPKRVAGLKLTWDAKEKWLEVGWNNRTGYILTSNIAFWEPENETVEYPVNEYKTESVEGRRKAQVSTPMSHVFEGRGHGKTKV